MSKFIVPTIVAVTVLVLAHTVLYEPFHGSEKPQKPKA